MTNVRGWPLLFALLTAGSNLAAQTALTTEVTLSGHFAKGAVGPKVTWFDRSHQNDLIFGSWNRQEDFRGTFATGTFKAPPILDVYVAGYPEGSGVAIYLERAKGGERLALRTRVNPAESWQLRSWKLGPEWAGSPVHLLVDSRSVSGPNTWVGISLPRRGALHLGRSIPRAVFRVSLLWLLAFLMILPGVGIAFALRRRLSLDAAGVALVSIMATGLAGYASFAVYFIDSQAGKLFAVLLVCCGFALVLRKPNRDLWPLLALPVAAAFLVAGAYCCFAFLYVTDADPAIEVEHRFFLNPLPPDNVIPLVVSRRLYRGESLRPILFSGWRTSDRPPLQAALVAMNRPFCIGFSPELHYQLSGMALQCTWIVALWVLLVRLGFGPRQTVPVIGFAILTGFAFLHSVYVWPKLLAAAFVLLGISLVLPQQRPRPMLAGMCVALGMLSHTGAFFTVAGFTALFLFERHRVSWKAVGTGTICAVLLLLPWTLFQKVYNPPGDRLLKANLAGELDAKGSLQEVVATAYQKLSWQEVVNRRALDVRTLFVADLANYGKTGWQANLRAFLDEDFFALFHALGLLNWGLVVRLSPLWRRVPDRQRYRLIDRLVVCVGVSIAIWTVLMFDAGATWIHQGSLANLLLLMAAFAIYIGAVHPRALYWLLAVQAFFVFPIFLFSKRFVEARPGSLFDGWMDPGMLISGIALCCLLAGVGWRGRCRV